MHVDSAQIEKGRSLEYDVCIVGGGAAGITTARRLMRTSLEVCLLERGGIQPSQTKNSSSSVECVGLPYRSLPEEQDRCLGGATNRWGGLCAPLDPIDFRERPWVPHSGWPIDREDLDPYYRLAHELLRLGPFTFDPEYWEEQIEAYRRFLPDSSTLVDRVIQFSNSRFDAGVSSDGASKKRKREDREPNEAVRFGERFREELVQASSVTVLTNATVTEICTPLSAATVSDLAVAGPGGIEFTVRADQYVLACGGIENPRLLLGSDRHVQPGLGNRHDLVGRFFMESPHVPSASVKLSSPGSLDAYRKHFSSFRIPQFHLGLSEHTQRSEQILNGRLRLDTRSSGIRSAQALWRKLARKEPGNMDGHRILNEIKSILQDPASVTRGILSTIGLDGSSSPRFGRFNVLTIAEQSPNPSSRVTLGENRDAHGRRLPRVDWRLSELDRRSVRRLNQIFDRELRRTDSGRLRMADWLKDERAWRPDAPPDPERFWTLRDPSRFWGVWHYMGTTRMASVAEEGVCSPECRVFGIDNLFVAGSSVFPTSGGVPPTFTIVALSLRLADHLAERAGAYSTMQTAKHSPGGIDE